MGKNEKTNAMRILDQKGISYETRSYEHQNEALDAVKVAELLQADPWSVFKTLVLMDAKNTCYVCVIPGPCELDLKRAAAAFCVKSLRMLHVDELKPYTGYIRGGCSPIGMKKQYKTLIDSTAIDLPFLFVSAGQIGTQLKLKPSDLLRASGAEYAEISRI
ncbi:MAG: Cys-tRNA(Pro) deacylase [Bacillota bacterium]|nr:Cys-tRNA(Pro) deacylase [Bacillota bacterium]